MTAEERAKTVLAANRNVGRRLRAHVAEPLMEDLEQAVELAIREAEQAMKERCAKVVLEGATLIEQNIHAAIVDGPGAILARATMSLE